MCTDGNVYGRHVYGRQYVGAIWQPKFRGYKETEKQVLRPISRRNTNGKAQRYIGGSSEPGLGLVFKAQCKKTRTRFGKVKSRG
jgi:hypothetical protein